MSAIRNDRLNEEIKKCISEIVRELKDPRLSPMTTITQVEVTPDLKFGKVYVSVYDKEEAVRTESVDALNHGNKFITRELGKRMQIRRLPQLKFELDNSIAYSVHIAKILNELNISLEEEERE